MSNRPWHKRFHGDAIAGYMGLTLEERGAYSTLLDYLYDRGEPLTGNIRMLAGFLDVSVRKAESVVASLIAKGKLERLADGRLTNKRFEKMRENDAKTSDHKAEIGSVGGRQSSENRKKHKENKDGGKQVLETGSSYPEARSQRLESKKKESNGAHAPLLPSLEFPTWWPSEAWGGFVEMRKKIKAPLTDAAVKLCIAELSGFRSSGHDPVAIINQSTQKGWRGLFPLKNGFDRGAPAKAPEPSMLDWVGRLVVFHGIEADDDCPKGTWSTKLGPAPGQPGCLVPPEAFRQFEAKFGPAIAAAR